MRVTATMLLVCGLLVAAPAPAMPQDAPGAQPATMASTTGHWWAMISKEFVDAADAMPAEKWGFKPTGGAFDNVRTFAEQVKHVACANEAFSSEIAHKDPPPNCETGGPNPAKTKPELMQYLRQSFAQMTDVFTGITPGNALDAAGGPYGGQSTRLGLATLAVWHASDHYGQLVVYLRMNGIVPPASR